MHAVIDLADRSSRMKDYYDLYHLLNSFNYDSEMLKEAVNRTFENRHTEYSQEEKFFQDNFPDNVQMQTRWTAFLRKSTIECDMSFSDIARWLQRELRPYWEELAK